jgi:hypothetical protein
MTDEPRLPVRTRLREKLPEILLEAGSVVFALLLAYGVDEWRENRANAALAARARAGIEAEIRANQSEVRHNHEAHVKVLAGMPALVKQAEALHEGTVTKGEISVNIGVAQLSTAAWQAAQTTQAMQFLDFDWVRQIAKLYELQRMYAMAQDQVVAQMSELDDPNLAPPLRRVQGKLHLLVDVENSLLRGYEDPDLKLPATAKP